MTKAAVASNASIVWFRHDLRLEDNPALHAAIGRGGPVVPVFIWAPEEEGAWPQGAASRYWLHQSLASLDASLRKLGSQLIMRRGPSLDTLRSLVRETGATAVYWNRRYEPAAIARDAAVKSALRDDGLTVDSFNSTLLVEPWEIATKQDKPYQVFTPYWRTCLAQLSLPDAIRAPKKLAVPAVLPRSLALDALQLEPSVDWAGGIRAAWTPGESGARAQVKRFLDDALANYSEGRDRPDQTGTSRLSPHLHFGEIGPRQVLRALMQSGVWDTRSGTVSGSDKFVSELGWREFSYHLLYHFPHTAERPLNTAFERFPWRDDPEGLAAWQRGRTGYPIVDAGMRELWTTGWMHNRVRMIVASFLTKDLMIPWQAGAVWFWDTLVDADLASNTQGWQWTSGCGADAAPYFRVFNPVGQGERFDPEGAYVRRWVPELSGMPAKWIHKPWEAPASVLAEAGVTLGSKYPAPVVDHGVVRLRALAGYETIRRGGKG
ncbi:MAG: DNA photolyase family protein [Candidatus Hydrogenedentes bacterium]|nr:DNA photolyase family protein [Candidatus Hydrogenedentota bacterium]